MPAWFYPLMVALLAVLWLFAVVLLASTFIGGPPLVNPATAVTFFAVVTMLLAVLYFIGIRKE